jgi:general secretion pathway protein D
VADNLPFFRVKTNVQTNFNANGRQNFQENIISSSEMRTVPVGFIMTVQPSIDPSTREIVLYLKPTITSVKQLRNDPAVEITAKRYKLEDVKSEIPVISVREIDSILRMESGSIAVLGGLMQESANNTSAGLPGLGETPLSFLTHGKSDDHVITELVIFIKASIVSKRKKHGYDKHLYQKFFTDPRPLEHNKRVKS